MLVVIILFSDGNPKICKLKFRQIPEGFTDSSNSPPRIPPARITNANDGSAEPEYELEQRRDALTGPYLEESNNLVASKKALARRKNISGTTRARPNEERMSFTPINDSGQRTGDVLAASRSDDVHTRGDPSNAFRANESNHTCVFKDGKDDSSGLKRNTSQMSSLDSGQSKRARLQEHSARMLELLKTHPPSMSYDIREDHTGHSLREPQTEERPHENMTCGRCRKLKIRCDRKRPCSHCREKGCGSYYSKTSLDWRLHLHAGHR